MEQQDDKMQFNLDEMKVLNRVIKYIGNEGLVDILRLFVDKQNALGDELYKVQVTKLCNDLIKMDKVID